jgi:hypothetical protein
MVAGDTDDRRMFQQRRYPSPQTLRRCSRQRVGRTRRVGVGRAPGLAPVVAPTMGIAVLAPHVVVLSGDLPPSGPPFGRGQDRQTEKRSPPSVSALGRTFPPTQVFGLSGILKSDRCRSQRAQQFPVALDSAALLCRCHRDHQYFRVHLRVRHLATLAEIEEQQRVASDAGFGPSLGGFRSRNGMDFRPGSRFDFSAWLSGILGGLAVGHGHRRPLWRDRRSPLTQRVREIETPHRARGPTAGRGDPASSSGHGAAAHRERQWALA